MSYDVIRACFFLMLASLVATLGWHGFIYLALAAGLMVVVGLAIGLVSSLFDGTYSRTRYPFE